MDIKVAANSVMPLCGLEKVSLLWKTSVGLSGSTLHHSLPCSVSWEANLHMWHINVLSCWTSFWLVQPMEAAAENWKEEVRRGIYSPASLLASLLKADFLFQTLSLSLSLKLLPLSSNIYSLSCLSSPRTLYLPSLVSPHHALPLWTVFAWTSVQITQFECTINFLLRQI